MENIGYLYVHAYQYEGLQIAWKTFVIVSKLSQFSEKKEDFENYGESLKRHYRHICIETYQKSKRYSSILLWLHSSLLHL